MTTASPVPDDDTAPCALCEDQTPTDDLITTDNDDCVCPNCVDQHFTYSNCMETWIPNSSSAAFYDSDDRATRQWQRNNAYWSSTASEWFLSENARDEYEAENDDESDDSNLYGYHDCTVVEVHGWPYATPHDSMCFGVELEMEPARGDQDDLIAALGGKDGNGSYILMQDGSLDYGGLEMITLPYTLEYHKSLFKWDNVLAKVSKLGKSGKDTSNCGMHVHVNRKALSPLQLGKMLVFVNSDRNALLVDTVAQRSSTGFAKKVVKKVAYGRDPRAFAETRYEALNVTHRTVEFRIFRGNLRAERVLKNIEFCDAVCNYCKDAGIREVETYNGFLEWLGKRSKTYPNLVKFLKLKSVMKFTPETVTTDDI